MAKNHMHLTYALKNGEVVCISDVESGLKCECNCPSCGEPLIAKKGKIMMHHFAHCSGHECEYGYETSLHLAAKKLIEQSKKIVIPAVYVTFGNKKAELVSEAKEIKIDKVQLEKKYGDIIPDIVISSEGKELFVEIFVTHRIDDAKLKKLENADISTIEIDLSKQDHTISHDELEKILLSDCDEKKWKYNALANKWHRKFLDVSQELETVSRGFALQVDDCPIGVRHWHGKPYANAIDDCMGCKYCISFNDGASISCSGASGIASIPDFDVPIEDRKKKIQMDRSDEKSDYLAKGKCPNCGGQLMKRNGPYGQFWGCSNYPHCRFTANIDVETGELITKA